MSDEKEKPEAAANEQDRPLSPHQRTLQTWREQDRQREENLQRSEAFDRESHKRTRQIWRDRDRMIRENIERRGW